MGIILDALYDLFGYEEMVEEDLVMGGGEMTTSATVVTDPVVKDPVVIDPADIAQAEEFEILLEKTEDLLEVYKQTGDKHEIAAHLHEQTLAAGEMVADRIHGWQALHSQHKAQLDEYSALLGQFQSQ